MERQLELTTHEARRTQLHEAIAELDRRIAASTAAKAAAAAK
jgi:hypothetical protein